MRRKTETESTIEMSTAQKDYEQAIGLLSGNAEMLAVERRIRAYVKELDEKAAAPKKERAERKKMFAVHLDFVQHELPRSKAGADACASITAYVDGLNTDYEKVCAEMLDDAAALREVDNFERIKELEKELKAVHDELGQSLTTLAMLADGTDGV